DPLARIATLKASRQDSYDRARITLNVDRTSPEAVAREIAGLLDQTTDTERPGGTPHAPGGTSKTFVRLGIPERTGELIRAAYPRATRAWIISDTNVAALHASGVSEKLDAHDFSVSLLTVEPGESSKSLKTTGELYDQMLNGGVE